MGETTSSELICLECGYSLRGIESERCPECGIVLDWERLSATRIPWEHRKHLGELRAFLKTMWMVIRRPGAFAKEIDRAISFADAQSFRWMVVALACIPAMIAIIVLGRMRDSKEALPGLERLQTGIASQLTPPTASQELFMSYWAGALLWPVPIIAVFLLFAGVTGVASYMFHPKTLPVERQNRAVALSYYACAPLAMLFVPTSLITIVIVMFGRISRPSGPTNLEFTLGAIGEASLLVILASWWFATLRFLHQATQCSIARMVLAAFSLPALWMTLLLLTCWCLPFLVGFVWLLAQN